MTALALFALDGSVAAEPQRVRRPGAEKQAALGQFMTPSAVADFMAAQFDSTRLKDVRLLDAGAGQGALSKAFARRWSEQGAAGRSLAIDAFEFDPAMIAALRTSFTELDGDRRIARSIVAGDFIAEAVSRIRMGDRPYTHAILNPPYKKISSASPARRALASVGIETVNLYSGFVALTLDLLSPGGELVAIIPRSFCNGPYYKPFRNFLLSRASIESIHLFTARDKAFADDNVLQENVVIRLRKGAKQGPVLLSSSTDATFSDLQSRTVPFTQIVPSADRERFIHIPVIKDGDALSRLDTYRSTLGDLGLSVSTGPVVDFRLKRHLRAMPGEGDAPLLYPGHFGSGRLEWPRVGFRKSNAIALNADTSRWLFPYGYYVVVRRFSSKEEKRRIVASLLDPAMLPPGPIGIENHLNIFHRGRGPMSEQLARGLAVYLNAKVVDDWFRQFNGHTQVNATDLRSLHYPNAERLIELGQWSKANPDASPQAIDEKIGRER